jgi:hypothetical protein
MTAIAEDIDVVRDLGGGEWRRSRLLRLRGAVSTMAMTAAVIPAKGTLNMFAFSLMR